jgi:CyaY protein
MDEHDFQRIADAELQRLEARLEAIEGDFDVETKPGGIIELEFEDGSKIIINRHLAAREIWIAARSGGFHFRPEGRSWIGTRDGELLTTCLARCISQHSGTPVAVESLV